MNGAIEIYLCLLSKSIAVRPVELTVIECRIPAEILFNTEREFTGNALEIRTHLMRLRRKLSEDAGSPRYNFAAHRVSYRMAEAELSGSGASHDSLRGLDFPTS